MTRMNLLGALGALAMTLGLVPALVLVLALTGSQPAQADPLKIRVAYVVPVANWASLLAEKKDLAKHWGTSYDFEAVRYQGTPPMITALATGELEIADLAYSTLGLAIQNAGIDDLQVIADEFQDGVPGYYSDEFFVRKDGAINKIEDLKGKVIATNAAGSGVDIAMKAMLHKHGLDDKRDYTTIEAPFPAMASMLAEKKVDMVPGVLPFSLNPALRDPNNVLFTQEQGVGRTQMIIWSARKSFIDKNRSALVDFMEDALRIERWYLDPKNHAEVVAIGARLLKVPPERLDWLFTKQDYYRDADGKPNLDALKKNVDMTKELGFFSGAVDIGQHTDLSIVTDAAKRLQ
jgi:sulfonate transport system substrate-binding protein